MWTLWGTAAFGARMQWKIAALSGLLCLTHCGHPVPADKVEFVGVWSGADLRLEIHAGGMLDLRREGRLGSVTFQGARLEIRGASMIVGLWPWRTQLAMERAPHQDDGRWKMTVEGTELTREPTAVLGDAPPQPWQTDDWKAQCAANQAEACRNLADVLRRGESSSQTVAAILDFLEKACNAGHGQSCLDLVATLQTSQDPIDTKRAAALHERACSSGVLGCTNLGNAYLHGEGVERDVARAARLFEKACAGKVAAACWNLGLLYRTGEGVARDEDRARQLANQACALGDAEACAHVADTLGGPASDQDPTRAAALYTKACEGGAMLACFNRALMLLSGSGTSPDAKKAAELFRRACKLKHPESCYNLGSLLAEGRGVKKDMKSAAGSFERACTLGYGGACENLARLLRSGDGVPQDLVESVPLFAKACALGNYESCYDLALAYLTGRGAKTDLSKASIHMTTACEHDFMRACWALGKSYYFGEGVKQDQREALRLLVKACGGGEPGACFDLGNHYMTSIERDLDKARGYFATGCTMGGPDACNNLAMMYRMGVGVAPNQEQALALFGKACAAGNEKGCENAREMAAPRR